MGVVSSEGERALAELAGPLAALDPGSIVRPGTDPHTAAVTGILVADYLTQAHVRARLESVALRPEEPAQLGRCARAILAVLGTLGGDYLAESTPVPSELVASGNQARTMVIETLRKALPEDRDLVGSFDAVRHGAGVVDLVYDLRTLADLALTQAGLALQPQVAAAAAGARSAAGALELALRSADTPAEAKARNTLARLWTLFVVAYERAAHAGRELTRDEGRELQFPPLAVVGAHRRVQRRSLSLVPPRVKPPLPVAAGRGAKPGPPLPVEELEERDAIEELAESSAPAKEATTSQLRQAVREVVDIEVGIASQSNFYQGFTENLSSGGVFVATYATKPIGAKLEIALSFPNGDELRVPGIVRWLREAAGDCWPGMGVQFESLAPRDEAKVRAFLALREPIFFED